MLTNFTNNNIDLFTKFNSIINLNIRIFFFFFIVFLYLRLRYLPLLVLFVEVIRFLCTYFKRNAFLWLIGLVLLPFCLLYM